MPTAVISDPAGIALFRLKAQLSACRLELRGIRVLRGRSMIQAIKEAHKLTGRREAVVNQFVEIVEKRTAEYMNLCAGAKGAN